MYYFISIFTFGGSDSFSGCIGINSQFSKSIAIFELRE